MNLTTKPMPILTPSIPLPSAAGGRQPWLAKFYQGAVLNSLEPLGRGSLRLELPGGGVRQFGDSNAPTQALIRIRNGNFFRRCVLFGDIGFGESFVENEWETPDITAVISWFIENHERAPTLSGTKAKNSILNLCRAVNRRIHACRSNTEDMSLRNIRDHYDLGNDFYRLFLDRTMTYSSAYFDSGAGTLEAAQLAKYDRLCRLLRLQPNDRVLEIGGGWGGFACHAAKHYGCHVTTVTISEAQHSYASRLFKAKGLEAKTEVRLCDYRRITGSYDKIVSIEMLEAVGDEFLETFFQTCQSLLKQDGLMALQMITCPDHRYAALLRGVDWIQKHIFPGSLLLSIGRVNEAIHTTSGMVMTDLKDLGNSYARTLKCWREAFNARQNDILSLGFDPRFLRKWNYYFSYCEAAFAQRHISAVQVLYSRPNNPVLGDRINP